MTRTTADGWRRARIRRASTTAAAVIACLALAVAGAANAIARTARVGTQATGGPAVTAPAVVTPGRLVTVAVSGFTPGVRVDVQFGVDFHPVRNCCVTAVQ